MIKILQTINALPDFLWRWFEHVVIMLGGRTIAMLCMSLVIAIASVIFTDSWLLSISRQVETLRLSRINIGTLNQLKTNLYEAESAQRGYLLTKRVEYLNPYYGALNKARASIEMSKKLFEEIYANETEVFDITPLMTISHSLEAKATEMALTIDLAKKNKIDEAIMVLNLDHGRIEMRKFTRLTDELIENQSLYVDEMIKKRRATLIYARASVIGGALLLILLVVLVIKQLLKELYVRSQLQQQVVKENTIYEQKLQLQTKLLRSLALDYQAHVERERQKLSRELHDELGSIFTATKMDIAWVIKKMSASAPEIAEKLRKTSSYVDQGIQFQRHIVQELHPAMLTTFGFWPALNSLISDAAERNNWQLTLNLPDENTKLNETISLVVYRIVQETLNNANKYAKATAVLVDVVVDDQHIKLEIQDNGIGMDTRLEKENTHGLAGMRHRVLAIGGHFELISEPNKGVLTRALIPLDVSAH